MPETLAESAESAAPDVSRPRFYRVAQVAALAECSLWTVYRLVKTGKLACVRLGAAIRIPTEEFDRLLTPRSRASAA